MSKSIRQQFADTMLATGQKDPNLMVMVGDISHFALQPFAKACPGRYFNIGICEPTMMSMCAGMSKVGFNVVVHTIAPFLIERSFEQIKLDFCYQKIPGNIVTVGSAFDYANLGCTHHCYGDFALLKTLQNTQVIYPASTQEFDELFTQSYQSGYTNIYRIPGKAHDFGWERHSLITGKGIKVCEGTDLTIVATGPQLISAMGARDKLMAQGWSPEIIYIHTVKPLDTEIIYNSVSKTKRCLVVEEHMENGGLGTDVLQVIYGIKDVQWATIGVPNEFIHAYGSYDHHCKRLGLSPEGIVARVEKCFSKVSELAAV